MSLFEHKQTDHALQKYDKSLDPPEELKTDRPVCLPVPFVDDRDAKNLRHCYQSPIPRFFSYQYIRPVEFPRLILEIFANLIILRTQRTVKLLHC